MSKLCMNDGQRGAGKLVSETNAEKVEQHVRRLRSKKELEEFEELK